MYTNGENDEDVERERMIRVKVCVVMIFSSGLLLMMVKKLL